MAKPPVKRATQRKAPTQRDFKHTWFVREWMLQAKKKQADLMKELGWARSKASTVWNGQQYTQAIIDDLAPWLQARPYELLMHPADAFALRQLRESAVRIASVKEPEPEADRQQALRRAG